MDMRTKYKNTEVGFIPKDWSVRNLGSEIVGLVAGVSVNSVDENIRQYSHEQKILKTSAISQGRFEPEEAKKIAPRDISRARTNPKANTLIVSRMNTPALVGEVGYVHDDFPDLFLPDRLWMTEFHRDTQICVQWLNYLLNTEQFKSKIKGSATGTSGTMKNISKGDIFSIFIPWPEPPEQRAIAKVLSDMDDLITGLDRLIAKKRDIKQATMQQLLTGDTRLPGFSDKWLEKKLGDLGSFLKGKGIRRDQVLSDGFPCVRYGEIYTRHHDHIREFYSFIDPETAKTSQPINRGDLLFTGSGETAEEIGKCVAYLGDGEAYAGGDIVILQPTGGDPKFLGYLMNSASIVEQKARAGQGDAVVHISATNLSKIRVLLPDEVEQEAIAKVLWEMDREISGLEAKRDKTRLIKQGMMQELLTGKTRLV